MHKGLTIKALQMHKGLMYTVLQITKAMVEGASAVSKDVWRAPYDVLQIGNL